MKCLNCNIELEGKREGSKFCSPKCRVTFSRKQSIVTDNVTLSDPIVTDNFKFRVIRNRTGDENPIREAKYWYDVPLGAEPIIQKGWPGKPDYMNGRQYFLWWKNEFALDEKDLPVILNPLPKYDNVRYERGGEGSRRWGA